MLTKLYISKNIVRIDLVEDMFTEQRTCSELVNNLQFWPLSKMIYRM